MKKLKAYLKRVFSFKFKDEKMEDEYYLIKSQNALNDFKISAYLLIFVNILGTISTARAKDWVSCSIVTAPTIIALFLLLLAKFIKKYYQYMTIVILFLFTLSRFIIFSLRYEIYQKVNCIYLGYVYAAMMIVTFSRIQNFLIKISLFMIFFGVRYGILVEADEQIFDVLGWIRFLVTDLFLLFILYSNDKTERKIFQNFFENRNELIKFKELLADSLPQSIRVVDFQTQKQLFANHTFLSSFDTSETVESEAGESIFIESSNGKPPLNLLRMDPTTLREADMQQGDNLVLNIPKCSLEELLRKLFQGDLIKEKALSINAYSNYQEKQKTFEIILKRVMWDRVEAIAIIFNETTYQEHLVALKIANANKDQILATVSHELRTPLHGIIGLLEIAETRVKDEEVLSNISLCKDNAHLLSSLVNSLLDLQQLTTGKLKLNENKMNIIKTLKNVTQLFKFQCDKKKISLDFDVQIDVPAYIKTDENRFKQILINLIGNAIKFTFTGGIKIEVRQDLEDHDCLVVSVSDTGIGIKEEDMGKLFKMYGKLANSSSVNKHGIGLGLTISNTLVGLLNGKTDEKGIEVISHYGVGSQFSFKILKDLGKKLKMIEDQETERKTLETSCCEIKLNTVADEYSGIFSPSSLPICSKVGNYMYERKGSNYTQNQQQIGPSASKHQIFLPKSNVAGSELLSIPSDFSKECVLVVDDNPFNILVAKNLMRDLGFSVKSASSGQEAIDIVKQCTQEGVSIKIIFMDCQMPIMDGYETAKSLKGLMEHGEIPTVPIFAWTANSGEKVVKQCFESGMTGFLSKPTTKENLIKAIRINSK